MNIDRKRNAFFVGRGHFWIKTVRGILVVELFYQFGFLFFFWKIYRKLLKILRLLYIMFLKCIFNLVKNYFWNMKYVSFYVKIFIININYILIFFCYIIRFNQIWFHIRKLLFDLLNYSFFKYKYKMFSFLLIFDLYKMHLRYVLEMFPFSFHPLLTVIARSLHFLDFPSSNLREKRKSPAGQSRLTFSLLPATEMTASLKTTDFFYFWYTIVTSYTFPVRFTRKLLSGNVLFFSRS